MFKMFFETNGNVLGGRTTNVRVVVDSQTTACGSGPRDVGFA
jgi:hypothetical protein